MIFVVLTGSVSKALTSKLSFKYKYYSIFFQLHKIIGFGPSVLQVVMGQEYELSVRQAAVIYLKNMVSWPRVDNSYDSLNLFDLVFGNFKKIFISLQTILAEPRESAGMLRYFAQICLQMFLFLLKFVMYRARKSKATVQKTSYKQVILNNSEIFLINSSNTV